LQVRAAGPVWTGGRVWIEFVSAEVAKMVSVDGERDEDKKTGEQEFHAASPDGSSA